MMKKVILIVGIFLLHFSNVEAQTQFIKYKKYLIPVNVDRTINLYYIDDVDDSRQANTDADPNGVQELPIVIGWKNIGLYNLVGVGADGNPDDYFNTSFTQYLLSLMDDNTPVYTGTELRDSIINKALEFGSLSNRLVIAIGGPREVVLDAIEHANSIGTPINNLIRVVGIQACLNGPPPPNTDPPTNCKDYTVGPAIRAALGSDNYHIIVDGRSAPSFRWFYSPTLAHVGNRNSWYQIHYHQSVIGRYFRDNSVNGYRLDRQNMVLNGCTEYGIELACGNKNSLSTVPSSKRRVFRAADFTALAYAVWGNEIWSTEFQTRMYSELEAGLNTLPK